MSTEQIAIADAGPLIHLDELSCLDLLEDFAAVHIPHAVYVEVLRHRPQVLNQAKIAWVQHHVQPSAAIAALAKIYTLHDGEKEALALCLQYRQALFFTDDTAAKLAAKTLSVSAHGTLGILIRAIATKQRSKDQVIETLMRIPQLSSLHIRPSLLEQIIQQVERNT